MYARIYEGRVILYLLFGWRFIGLAVLFYDMRNHWCINLIQLNRVNFYYYYDWWYYIIIVAMIFYPVLTEQLCGFAMMLSRTLLLFGCIFLLSYIFKYLVDLYCILFMITQLFLSMNHYWVKRLFHYYRKGRYLWQVPHIEHLYIKWRLLPNFKSVT